MNPRNIYIGIASVVVAIVLVATGITVWKRRSEIKDTLDTGRRKVRRMARSWYGRVANAADTVVHTERDPNTSRYGHPDTST